MDLALASSPAPPGVPRELLCFHAQQAAEKSIKAVLVFRGLPIHKTHSIGLLLDTVALARIDIPAEVKASIVLTDYAVAARYPGIYEPVTIEEHEQAIRLAGMVLEWAEGILGCDT